QLTGVPRLGPKLVLVEGTLDGGARVAAGCEPLDDVDADTVLPVDVWIAPNVHELARPNGGSIDKVTVIATAPWDDAVPVRDRPARFQLYGTTGELLTIEDATGDAGIVTLDCADHNDCHPRVPNGPLAKVVRVKWGLAPVRLSAFNSFAPVPG